INSNILFQFIPEWIRDSGEFEEGTVADVDDGIIGNMDDLIADLTVEVVQRGNAYVLSVMYSDKYSGVFIDRFIESFKLILHGMLDANDLSEINFVSDSDIQLLDSYNCTEHDLVYCDVLDAFNDNLSRCPDSALVSMYDRVYSYGEGAFIADRIAKSLIDLGVESGDCVGFLVPRSELYVFSVLGIMSMGGVYVPLDDALPD
ncbi:AMP-binding protein, partial [Methanobrevibacter sp.]